MASRSAATPIELTTVDGLAQLSFLIYNTLDARANEHNLSIIQTRLLGVLRDRTPGMKELAGLLGLDKSSTTGLVDRAEQRGLVTRVASSTDGRVVLVSLTEAGRVLVTEAAADFEADVRRALECLSAAERKTLSGLVSRVVVTHAARRPSSLLGT